ncbi:MAG TPA: hypothetical protein VMZ26_14900 [Pyrinomonadaceae bacterium]|nr:hypothetical protein [Pyrinomonadaceae bacterium]
MVRNILAVIAGIVVGSIVNGALINLGHYVVPLPPGADVSTMENLAVAMKSFGPEQFVFPFLAHAIGTLVGAFLAALIAVSHKMKIAIAIGILFLIGGLAAGIMIGSPMWYNAIDFIFAYMPMAWIGAKVAGILRGRELPR